MASSQHQYCLCGQTQENSEFMIQCDVCKDWFHGSCVFVKEYESHDIEKFHCPRCQPMCGPSVLKERRNWHRHDYSDGQADGKSVESGTPVFIRELKTRFFPSAEDVIVHVRGQQLTLPYFVQNGFDKPILAVSKDGLGLAMPPDTFTVNDIMDYIGEDFVLDAIDVGRQQDIKMNMKEWVTYFNSPEREKIYNVISLEFSKTRLAQLVRPPSIVQKLSWVENYWPEAGDNEDDMGPKRPLVMKYCLMGTEDSYTDFHIDFGGTSVWYHVLQGEKVFFLVPPTAVNLSLYERWLSSSNQSETFFGDQVSQCYRLVLERGQTLFIPSGWIHAVLTTMDSLVFGGNFLCSINIPMQIQVWEIDERTKTPAKYKFPSFEATHWYSAPFISQQLKDFNEGNRRPPNHLVNGAKVLVSALKSWSQDKERSKQHMIPKGIVPIRIIKQVAREVRAAEKLLTSKSIKGETKKAKLPVGRPRRATAIKPEVLDFLKTKGEPEEQRTNGSLKSTPQDPSFEPKSSPSASRNDHSIYDFVDSEEDTLVVDESPPLHSSKRGKLSTSNSPSFKQRITSRSGPQQPTTVKSPVGKGAKRTPLAPAGNQPAKGRVRQANNNSNNQVPLRLKLTFNGASPSEDSATPSKAEGSAEDVPATPPSVHQQGQSLGGPKNGTLDDLLLAVDYAGEADSTRVSLEDDLSSGRTSPSTREAIAGMLSMSKSAFTFAEEPPLSSASSTPGLTSSQTNDPSLCDSRLLGLSLLASRVNDSNQLMPAPPPFTNVHSGSNVMSRIGRKRQASPSQEDDFEASLKNCHQDKDFIYLGLDVSDDELHVFKPRGRGKKDESWNPTARVNISCPKPERPVREGVRKEAIECGLAAAAAKLADMPTPKRAYHRKKLPNEKSKDGSSSGNSSAPSSEGTTASSSSSSSSPLSLASTLQNKKPRKGFATAKQRLGKILKIHKMIY